MPGEKENKTCAYNIIVWIAFYLTPFIITDQESLSDREIAP